MTEVKVGQVYRNNGNYLTYKIVKIDTHVDCIYWDELNPDTTYPSDRWTISEMKSSYFTLYPLYNSPLYKAMSEEEK